MPPLLRGLREPSVGSLVWVACVGHTGYHSLCVITDGLECSEGSPEGEAEEGTSALPISLESFKHNYIVPNAALVLPTHSVAAPSTRHLPGQSDGP